MNRKSPQTTIGVTSQLNRACIMALRLPLSLVAVILSLAITDQALAQTDANFAAYCRQEFPNSIYQKTKQSWGIVHTCNQGGTLQNIDLAEACRLTTGSLDYTISGARVLCSGSAASAPQASAQDAGALDVAAYCRETFPNSIHEARKGPKGVEHYCRQTGASGGFTLQKADLASACRSQHKVDGFRKTGPQVICVAGGGNQTAGGGGGGGGKGFPPLKPEDIIDAKGSGEIFDKNIKYAHLQGCGSADPEFSMKQSVEAMARGLGGWVYQYMGLTMPCPGLTGGKIVKFQNVCNEFTGANPPMNVRLLPWGIPVCWKVGRKWRPPSRSEAGWGLNSKPLEGVCDQAYHGRLPHAEKIKKNVASIIKYKVKTFQVECFYIQRDRLHRILKRANSPDPETSAAKSPESATKTASLSDKDLQKEIAKVKAAIDALNKELAKTRANASYPGVDVEPLKQDIKTKYDKKKKETEEKKNQLDIDRGKERDRRQIASECDSADSCRKLELKNKYDKKKEQLDEELGDYKDNLDDELIKKQGDDKSRKIIETLKPKLKNLKDLRAKLDAEQQRRYKEADERQKNLPPPITDTDSEGPLIPDEDLNKSGER